MMHGHMNVKLHNAVYINNTHIQYKKYNNIKCYNIKYKNWIQSAFNCCDFMIIGLERPKHVGDKLHIVRDCSLNKVYSICFKS
jgi:hypothetical protein